jgi:hypothetical protein
VSYVPPNFGSMQEWARLVANAVNPTLQGSVSPNLVSGLSYQINSAQVVTSRQTGWSADTGTAKRTANATYAPGSALTFGAAYVEAEHDAAATRIAAIETALRDATQTIKALKDDLITHGLIGT